MPYLHSVYRFHSVILLLGLLSATVDFHGQNAWQLVYDPPLKKELTRTYFVRADMVKSVMTQYSTLLSEGYLDARIDTHTVDSVMYAKVNTGQRYKIQRYSWHQDSAATLVSRGQSFRKGVPFTADGLSRRTSNVLDEYENRGFPFVSILVKDLQMNNHDADIIFQLIPGPRIVMDSLVLRSNTKLPVRYIRSYLEFRKGELYNESKLLAVEKKLREIPFVTSRQSPEVLFTPGEADLFVFLEKKKANYFNGILGIRPDDRTGRINITGDAEIKLMNAFNGGEELYLNWRKMQAETQDLTVKTLLPYMFSTPIGIDGQLKIYKRDTTFTSVKTAAGLVFNFGGNDRLRLFIEKNATNQISSFITSQPLANVNSTLYGLSFQIEKLDYRFNPRKGFLLMAEGATGNRKVTASNIVSGDVANATPQRNIYRIEGNSEYYIPTFKSQCIMFGIKGAGIFASSLFDNEMYRIGGLRTLRGIDEESIYSTSYAIGSIEYRLLFEENSALYLFMDQSWYESKSATMFATDTPLGFGAGVNFETKAGIFTFNYALGQQFDNPLLVRNAKISFGFRNVF